MKEQIIKLRAEGKTYNEIAAALKCSKGLVSYHCGLGQKEKNYKRNKRYKKDNPLSSKISFYKSRKKFFDKAKDFQRNRGTNGKNLQGRQYNFSAEDLLAKIGKNPICYLSGRSLDITNPSSYELDHIIPVSKGGESTLDNVQITLKEVNRMKYNLTKDELLSLCKEILEFNGYSVNKITNVRLS